MTQLSQGNARSTAIRAVAKANNLKLDIVETNPGKGVTDDYRKLNRLGRIPTFEGADNYILTECIAIAVYSESRLFSQCMVCARAWLQDEKIHIIQLSLAESLLVENVFTL